MMDGDQKWRNTKTNEPFLWGDGMYNFVPGRLQTLFNGTLSFLYWDTPISSRRIPHSFLTCMDKIFRLV
jgi:hypothetical protein